MFLNYIDVFLLGTFFILFIFGLTQYIFKRDETYYLYFTFGCVISIIRLFTVNIEAHGNSAFSASLMIRYLNCLTFIWGPYAYLLLAESLFPKAKREAISKVLLWVCIIVSVLIIVVFVPFKTNQFIYDYIILACMFYATYIFIIAFKRQYVFGVPLFIAHSLFLLAMIHDVLLGSNVIHTPFGELNRFAYLLYMVIALIVLSYKQRMMYEAYFRSHVNFLHAQIKPHFLYNTINTIRACCKTDDQKSAELLSLLSTYLRGKLTDNDDKLVPLSDEIQLIKAYLSIEKARYEERLTVNYDIDDHCDILIPCLTIQPIVENAVAHGLSPKIEGGTLNITIKKLEKYTQIIVEDNGVGIDQRKLDDLMKQNQTGIGLKNSNARLKQYYGNQLVISSKPNVGTKVEILIPHIGPNKSQEL